MLVSRQLWKKYRKKIKYDTKRGMFLIHATCNQRMAEVRLMLSLGKILRGHMTNDREMVTFFYCPFCEKHPPSLPENDTSASLDDFVEASMFDFP